MHVAIDGARLWFDVEGPSLVPDGDGMRERPTVILVHGGPGTYDHTYFKPWFGRLATVAQVVFLDLRDHGRSAWGDAAAWSFTRAADDLPAFCDALGIVRPVVLGHSMGGFVVLAYGARHPGHAGGLILVSTLARYDHHRLVDGFRQAAGDDVAELADRDYSGDEVTAAQWARVFAAFGPHVPDGEALARRRRNTAVGQHGMDLMRRLDLLDQLERITSPTLVIAGDLDPVTPVSAAQEIVDGLRPGVGRLEIVEGAGHFPWLDRPDRFGAVVERFIHESDE